MKNKQNPNRRQFLSTAALGAAGLSLTPSGLFAGPAILKTPRKAISMINGVQVGVITYSFRSLPDQSAEATLGYIKACGINAIELMGDPAEAFAGKPENPIDRRAMFSLMRAQREGGLSTNQEKELEEMRERMAAYNQEVAAWRAQTSMEPFEKIRQMYADAGVSIYAFKPRAFGQDNTDAEIDWGIRAAKALGASHVTLEHPSDDAHTLKLGKMGAKHGIFVAYHGHEQQTPTFWDTALRQSTFNALNLDLGHYVAAGNAAPLDLIRDKFYRIRSMHVKDRQTPENGKGNVVWGTGDTPIGAALQLMRDNRYDFPATIELEYAIPDGSDPIAEVRKCLDYCAGALG
ncbi:sugar phosphate isomerase/epimerase [Robiginitalea sp. M366]|uniref:sugar phosphate isomerase/epimerase family protein n=1 Tax=Robiginitalea aestuariiviva TaxID=3036903 RepID=UPI00240D4DD3|nr:TIM barrel protein [Robiginitalea aestuariiviva]MDG1571135.1 sugar phosphate isomerase/epimerase [Robiginitalea aestuariiviva]